MKQRQGDSVDVVSRRAFRCGKSGTNSCPTNPLSGRIGPCKIGGFGRGWVSFAATHARVGHRDYRLQLVSSRVHLILGCCALDAVHFLSGSLKRRPFSRVAVLSGLRRRGMPAMAQAKTCERYPSRSKVGDSERPLVGQYQHFGCPRRT